MGAQTSGTPSRRAGILSPVATRTTAPGRLATNAITPYTTAAATPSDAPSPAAANAQAVTPSRGPQPPTLGRAAPCSTSNASGSISDVGAVSPALRAAIRNVATWPARTRADASAMAGHARHAHAAQAVVNATMDVAHHPAGQREVEEERLVVGSHRRAQRQLVAKAARHDPPAPRAAHRGDH